ncbi:MAG: flippase-like domain-containing protein [Flavobacteriales bacterium]|nr:flippase-like domain-containing protein [Flavobacteriales bacterium]
MRKAVWGTLKVAVPVALGIWLVLHFYRQLDDGQRAALFEAFGRASVPWLVLSNLLGWLSHVSRGWRWRYLLRHLGHEPGFWSCYHAVMGGYFMNMLLPRAGEASRAAMLYRTEGVPFEKGFGTILAERAVDMVMLLGIAGVTLLLQADKIDLFQARIAAFRAQQATGPDGQGLGWWVLALGVIGAAVAAFLVFTRPNLRARVMDGVRGFVEGVRSILRTPDKGPYLFHTALIWALYVAMFWVGFMALPETRDVPPAGVMAGFIAGSVGIVLVQGGIGAYPAFVALIVSVYMSGGEGGVIRPEALAMGWLLWVAQTLMIISLGGLSLLLVARKRSTP